MELCVTGDSVVAGLVPATSRDTNCDTSREISVKDYTEPHANLVDAWGQCHTKGWGVYQNTNPQPNNLQSVS